MKRSSRWMRRRKQRKEQMLQELAAKKIEDKLGDRMLDPSVDKNVQFIGKLLGDGSDVVTRFFTIQYTPDRRAAIMYIDGLVDLPLIDQFVLTPLMTEAEKIRTKTDLWEMVNESLIQTGEMRITAKMKDLVEGLLSGDTILLLDGESQGLIIGSKGWPMRSVEEPKTAAVVRGPREGFSETLRVNTALIRRRLRDPDLRMKNYKVGRRTRTDLVLCYIEGVVDSRIVEEVERRIQAIELDGVLESGYIEEMIQDNFWTPFPLIQNTERPDSAVSHLLEGKVVILVDGTPHALIAPAVFTQFYYSPEDYYERYMIATFLRFLRLVSLIIALLGPAFYIAFVSFHTEMLPSQLAIAMAAGRATVPFPSIVEALLMEVSVEILREASVRLPGPIGPTIGIVGALVIGEASVTAGLVSPLMVIVVGLTTISSYANPSYNAAISLRLLRFPIMIVAAGFGLYGIVLCLMLLLHHLVKLESFGVPYMAPMAPLRWQDVKDLLIRVPWSMMKKRPSIFRPQDPVREE
ncbi:spore germination protein [Planifilum fulgidum]|uniref:Spore germination protein n=1 Tax=Planifilum fulgidum TaxID=201973 RepID=A0A1I2SQW7_9BACL|nr:spore germination protein [Planifilum fulgidum]